MDPLLAGRSWLRCNLDLRSVHEPRLATRIRGLQWPSSIEPLIVGPKRRYRCRSATVGLLPFELT